MKFVTETDVQSETGVTLTVEEASGLISEASFSVFNLIQPNAIDEIRYLKKHQDNPLYKYPPAFRMFSTTSGMAGILLAELLPLMDRPPNEKEPTCRTDPYFFRCATMCAVAALMYASGAASSITFG